MRSSTSRCRVFRGFTAAASLKHDWEVEVDETTSGNVFRGFTAAASLKLVPWVANPVWISGFPRLHRRGLIEATQAILRMVRHMGGFPRLHRRGLIEALE